MRKVCSVSSALVCGLALAGVMFVAGSQRAEARPAYFGEFKALYPDLEEAAKTVKNCGVCHGGEGGADKKLRNDYGEAVGKSLGSKNEKAKEAIKDALLKAAAAKSGTDGKTFGDLIKDGKLPGKASE